MTLQERLQAHRNQLNETDWLIYSTIEAQGSRLGTLEQLAQLCHVSATGIFRFCQKLGLSGFSELKVLVKEKHQVIQGSSSQAKNAYHAIVQDLERFDSQALGRRVREAERIYVYAKSEVELRLAKALQRIFFPLGKPIIILPNDQALNEGLARMVDQFLWVLVVDSLTNLPLVLQNAFHLQGVYTFLLSRSNYLPVLADERFLVPDIGEGQEGVSISLTPYILALELLYLKILLENDTIFQK